MATRALPLLDQTSSREHDKPYAPRVARKRTIHRRAFSPRLPLWSQLPRFRVGLRAALLLVVYRSSLAVDRECRSDAGQRTAIMALLGDRSTASINEDLAKLGRSGRWGSGAATEFPAELIDVPRSDSKAEKNHLAGIRSVLRGNLTIELERSPSRAD